VLSHFLEMNCKSNRGITATEYRFHTADELIDVRAG
jgi:hypothetical protein